VAEEALDVAETLDGAVGAEVVTDWAGGWVVGAAVTLGLAEMVAVRLGTLPIELLMLPPHPAARHPATTMATSGEILFTECRMLFLPYWSWPLERP
jgi:hypothetical protein